MTPTLQDFYAECVASFRYVYMDVKGRKLFEDNTPDRGYQVWISSRTIKIKMRGKIVYYGTDIRRAASILYGITGNENWLRFVTGEKE